MRKKIVKALILCFITIAVTYTLINPYRVAFYTQGAIKMCVTSLVPTLFIFMVFSRILSHLCTTILPSNKLILFFSRLLRIPPTLVPICLTGLICGAPSGAFAICRLYDEGLCTKEQAKRACILSNNCSAAFILGFVSSVLGSLHTSLFMLISNISATFIVYMVFFRGEKEKPLSQSAPLQSKSSVSTILTESISSSVTATVTLCGYVIFFYTFTQVLCDELSPFLNYIGISEGLAGFISTATSSFFEVSSGVLRAGMLDSVEKAVLCAGAVSFTGLSMLFQVSGLLSQSGIPAREYFLSKCLCAIVCPIIVILLMLISPYTVSVSAYVRPETGGVCAGDIISLVLMTCIAFTGAYILFRVDKKHKK